MKSGLRGGPTPTSIILIPTLVLSSDEMALLLGVILSRTTSVSQTVQLTLTLH